MVTCKAAGWMATAIGSLCACTALAQTPATAGSADQVSPDANRTYFRTTSATEMFAPEPAATEPPPASDDALSMLRAANTRTTAAAVHVGRRDLGAIFLQRSRPDSTPFIVNSTTGANVLGPQNFTFPWSGGADAGLIRYGQYADLDFRYFGVNNSNSTVAPFTAPAGIVFAIPGAGPPTTQPANLSGNYLTNLNSVEINARRNIFSNLSVLAGFRYISFRDAMSQQSTSIVGPPASEAFGISAANNLYGGQIGLAGVLWTYNRFRIESWIKAGIYGNSASNSVSISESPGGTFVLNSSHQHTAFVGDLNFTGVYQLNDRWAIRSGYQLLWLTGVATAGDQLHNLTLGPGPASTLSMNTSHTAFFNGATIGLERLW